MADFRNQESRFETSTMQLQIFDRLCHKLWTAKIRGSVYCFWAKWMYARCINNFINFIYIPCMYGCQPLHILYILNTPRSTYTQMKKKHFQWWQQVGTNKLFCCTVNIVQYIRNELSVKELVTKVMIHDTVHVYCIWWRSPSYFLCLVLWFSSSVDCSMDCSSMIFIFHQITILRCELWCVYFFCGHGVNWQADCICCVSWRSA